MAGATQQPEVGWRVAATSASRVNMIEFVGVVDFFAATTCPTISRGTFILHELRQASLVGLATPFTVNAFMQGIITPVRRRAHFFPRPDRLQPLQAIRQRTARNRNLPNPLDH